MVKTPYFHCKQHRGTTIPQGPQSSQKKKKKITGRANGLWNDLSFGVVLPSKTSQKSSKVSSPETGMLHPSTTEMQPE